MFESKSKVLQDATLEVHRIEFTDKPDEYEDEEENDEEDDESTYRYVLVKCTVRPA